VGSGERGISRRRAGGAGAGLGAVGRFFISDFRIGAERL